MVANEIPALEMGRQNAYNKIKKFIIAS